MSLIMPNRLFDLDLGNESYDVLKYCLPSVKKNAGDRFDGFQNSLKLSSGYSEKNDNDFRRIKLNMLPENMFTEIKSSMSDWEEYMFCKEHEQLTKPATSTSDLPAVRNGNCIIQYSNQNNVNKNSFACSKIEIRSHEDAWTDDISEEEKKLRELYANAERARGNEAYNLGDFIKACEHYSNSLAVIPSTKCYNNRAQANIKLQNYTSALPDLSEVLKQDRTNAKALTRRAVCRLSLHMYHEALCDLLTILDGNPKNKEALSLKNDVIREMSKLKGRKFRTRLVSNLKKTFEIDESQLPTYVECDGDYVIEMDKSGCVKSCVCNYCNTEDLSARFRSNSLRIKERPRWQRLTATLLNELHINVNATNQLKETKNDYLKLVDNAAGNSRETSKFYEKQVQTKNLTNAAYSSNPVSTRMTSSAALPAKQTKSMKDTKNINHQRYESFENELQKLRLEEPCLQNGYVDETMPDELKNVPLSALKDKFDCRLDDVSLEKMIRYVCRKFQLEKDWPLISQYLSVIASLQRFRIIIAFIDDDVKNELLQVFDKAIVLNLENASHLKSLYFQLDL